MSETMDFTEELPGLPERPWAQLGRVLVNMMAWWATIQLVGHPAVLERVFRHAFVPFFQKTELYQRPLPEKNGWEQFLINIAEWYRPAPDAYNAFKPLERVAYAYFQRAYWAAELTRPPEDKEDYIRLTGPELLFPDGEKEKVWDIIAFRRRWGRDWTKPEDEKSVAATRHAIVDKYSWA